MKNTKYFDSVQDVNNYYPDGVPSNVIAIVGDGSNVFISSDNAGSRNQQYYSADMTNDEIVAEQVQAAEQQGYDTGYAAGQAAAGTNWLDVLFLDEKAKAEQALNVSTWNGDAVKFNFAIEVSNCNGGCVDPMGAAAIIQGVLQDATIAKVIKITKDANDNAIITYHNCYTNFDGTTIGAISLDGVTYYNKICLWSDTITLAVGDEVIMDVAASVSGISTMLFGGYDKNAKTEEEGVITWLPATYKCTTAGTYTFGIWVDVPQAQNPQAIAFVSTMFNYEGSATVPAITVPTGETSGGSSEPTIEELNNMSMGTVLASLYGTGTETITMQTGDLDHLDPETAKTAMDATNLQVTVDKYNETDGLTIDYNFTFDTDNTTYMNVQVSLDAGDKVGFSLTPANSDDYLFDSSCTWLFRYVDPENTGNGYKTHWFEAQNTGDYKFEITFGTDPESGDSTIEGYTFTEVVLP